MMTEQKTNNNGGNSPAATFRASPLSVTLWVNEKTNNEGEQFSVTSIVLERNYKDKEGEWQKTNQLRVNDLPKAQLLLAKAYEHLMLKEADSAVSIEEL